MAYVYADRDCMPLPVPEERAKVFRLALTTLDEIGVPYALGGGLALYFYTGIRRELRDFDLHVVPRDVERALRALREIGFTTTIKHEPWLAQAKHDFGKVDLVYGHGTWHAAVDHAWIDRGCPGYILGHPLTVAPPEELFWARALRLSRERTDSGDAFHLLVATGREMDWDHLLGRFGEDWEILLSHLIMFRYVFPSHADVIPPPIFDALLERLADSRHALPVGQPVCRGRLLDGSGTYDQYFAERGYLDERQERWENRRRRERLGYLHLVGD